MTAAPSVSSPALPSASVEVFSASGCRYCAIAKAKLKELCVPFTEIDVTVHGDDEASAHGRKSLAERVGRTSVPQIFVAGEHVGGCDELLAAVADGSFAARLSAAGISTETPAPDGADAGAGAAGEGLDIELAPKGGVLNYHKSPERGEHGGAAGQDAAALARELQARTLKLFDEFVTADGRGVDFERMASSAALLSYLHAAERLAAPAILPTLQAMAREERTAFWINIYNALVLHGGLAVPPGPADPAARGSFFSGASGVRYNVGGLALSLDDMEHAILRGSPAGDARSFAPDDALRLSLAVPRAQLDPRIHFALNCGARSCPPIKLYSADNLDRALALAAEAFCEAEVAVDVAAKAVTLSKILMWYGGDFAPKDDMPALLRKLVGYLPAGSQTAADLEALLATPDQITVELSDYDWSRNDA